MFHKREIKPMLLQEIEKPFQDSNYLYELKYDGIRVICYVSKDSLFLITRNQVDVTHLYPELLSIKKLVGNKKVIFDGELVAFKEGKPSFSELQKRSHLKKQEKIERISKEIPVALVVFDILYENKNLMDLQLIERKKILDKYKDTDVFIKTRVFQDGLKLFQNVKKIGLEGIIAKKKNSIYLPGTRSYDWLKIKNFKKEEFYIHGYIKNTQKISLLLGEYQKGQLFYVGKVSIMPDHPIIKRIEKQKKINNQFINHKEKGFYIKPINKILVHYMERSEDNHLRQPFIRH